MVGFEIDFLEWGVSGNVCAVQFRQTAVEVHVVGQQELAEVGRAAVEHFVEREFERCAQVGDDIGCKLRKRSAGLSTNRAAARFSASRGRTRGVSTLVRKSGSIRWSWATISSCVASLPFLAAVEELSSGSESQRPNEIREAISNWSVASPPTSRYRNRGDLSTSSTTRFTPASGVGTLQIVDERKTFAAPR